MVINRCPYGSSAEFGMRDGMVECKECRFWLQYVDEDPKTGPELSNYGICCNPRSVYLFEITHKEGFCKHGELKKKEAPAD